MESTEVTWKIHAWQANIKMWQRMATRLLNEEPKRPDLAKRYERAIAMAREEIRLLEEGPTP